MKGREEFSFWILKTSVVGLSFPTTGMQLNLKGNGIEYLFKYEWTRDLPIFSSSFLFS